MTVRVTLPSVLRACAGGQAELSVAGATVREALNNLAERFPALAERILEPDFNRLRPFVILFVNDEDIRFLEGFDTPLRPGDTLAVIPAIAGG